MELIIGTRKSKLAVTQADIVIDLLKKDGKVDAKKELIVTEGDRRLDVSLNKIGGKGLFVKEIELALLNEEVDAAVHSMKDMPFDLLDAFELTAILKREDVRDVFIARDGKTKFENLKQGAVVGTSSIRRGAFIKALRPDINIVPIRGNVQTRLQKMEQEEMDGIILAAAGLKRLDLEDIITSYFDPKEFVPAIGQGALGIECLKNSKHKHYFETLDNKEVRTAVEAERHFMRILNGDCHSVIGAYSEIKDDKIFMIGVWGEEEKIIRAEIIGNVKDSIKLAEELAKKILKNKG
ncbi:MAG: hydroxymethylbilane synthase [Sarcina sp.]